MSTTPKFAIGDHVTIAPSDGLDYGSGIISEVHSKGTEHYYFVKQGTGTLGVMEDSLTIIYPHRVLLAREVRRRWTLAFDKDSPDALRHRDKLARLVETLIGAVPDDWTDPLADLREDIYGPQGRTP
jgi:hypothetical protein